MTTVTKQNICILLATHNGGRYINDQVRSIQRQSSKDWVLLIRDDGSTDDTPKLLANLAASDSRISLLGSAGLPTSGAAQNFNLLMATGLKTNSNLFFLCDQDDYWESDKLERQSRAFPGHGMEDSPLLVHSDLTLVDENLELTHPSLIRHMALEAEPQPAINFLLSRNFVTGCATACNRRLLEEALPIPVSAIMHDWWLAAVAASIGDIRHIEAPLTRYRQHDTNTIGAKGFWHGLNPTNNWVKGWKAGNTEFLATFDQIAALCEHADSRASWPQEQRQLLHDYAQMLHLPRRKRLARAHKLKVRQGNLLLQLIFYLRLVTINRR